jgi:hypothetical protein
MIPIIFSQVSGRVSISNMEDAVGVFAIELVEQKYINKVRAIHRKI